MKFAIRLTLFAIFVYCLLSYWGIRSPDSEVVFRTTQALATRGTFAVSEQLDWEGFGLSKGKDGQMYSIFGPGEAIAAVPLYKLAEMINHTGWYKRATYFVSKSHYTEDGLSDFVEGKIPQKLEPHAKRTLMSLLNIIVGALCVFVFFFIIKALTQSERSAIFTSILFAFGTLILPYTGTFFSEILATFFVLLSFYMLIHNSVAETPRSSVNLLASGVFLGLATATHITAILFAPFFCIYGAISIKNNDLKISRRNLLGVSIFMFGLGLMLFLIAYHNYARFGDIFETGRTVGDTSTFGYGTFVTPWRGLWGLLFSAGKGLIFYCPAIILGLISWPQFHKKNQILSFTIFSAALLRLFFIAARSDWHGGFSLGPRFLVMIVPFLLLPLGDYVAKKTKVQDIKAMIFFAIISIICIAQQIYFSLGEIFSYYHIIKWQGLEQGVDVFKDDFLYLSWDLSPLRYLLNGYRGALLLNFIEDSNAAIWRFLVFVTAIILTFLYYSMMKREQVQDAFP